MMATLAHNELIADPRLKVSTQITYSCSKSTKEMIKKCEIYSKLTIKTLEHVNNVVLMLLLT